MKHTEIAADFQNWAEYFDTSATMTEAEFDAMPMEKRLSLLEDAFGPDDCCFAIMIDGQRSAELYDTRKDAENAMALWSLSLYERTGNFSHDQRAQIINVE